MENTDKKVDKFRRKIKSPEEIRAIIGDRPRKKTVVMCHGTFDIVHPGHLRHLMYAKERGDYLIASLTADVHIYKANHRPFVPQDLRAINLAALEFVDFVVIDSNAEPLENITKIEPDYFAKGFDYFHDGIPLKTQQEMAALERYGGEIIFTPGDIVYSSSHLIESAPPKIGAAKLYMLLESERISFDQIRATLTALNGVKVHVIGDTIVDSYIYCRPTGSLTKTPTLSAQFDRQIDFSGGAAIVAKHLRAAGAEVTFSTVLGDDPLKDFVVNDLKEAGIKLDVVVDRTRPTIQKSAFIANGYHVLRLGKMDNRIISEKSLTHFVDSLKSSSADVFVFSDFRHGIFARSSIPVLLNAVPPGKFKAADSQVASRWGNIVDFQGCDLITPNEREARFALGDQDSVVRPLALELYKRSNCKCLIMTLGERGIMTYCSEVSGVRDFFTVDSFADNVIDAVGAGDALMSYASLGLFISGNPVHASLLGTLAAGIACGQEGNIPIRNEDVLEKLNQVEKIINCQ